MRRCTVQGCPTVSLHSCVSGLATAASWLCYYRALQLAPASRVAPIDKLSVVVAIALGVVILGEPARRDAPCA